MDSQASGDDEEILEAAGVLVDGYENAQFSEDSQVREAIRSAFLAGARFAMFRAKYRAALRGADIDLGEKS